jgi:hypothetical protein
VLCGNSSLYFSILKGGRVCYPCVFEDPSFGLLFRSAAERYFGILEEIEKAILRELYTPILNPRVKGRGSRKECIYVSFEEARAEAVKIHGGEGKILEFVFGV